MEEHEQSVSIIATTIRDFYERRESYRIYHGSTNSTRPQTHKRVVDISALRNVVSIDPGSRIALVEPCCAMDHLVESTLKHGLVPPVVMEFPGITVGGGYSGSSGESSSFKYGFFSDTIISIEMILGNGAVVKASRDNREDLFNGAAGAMGTLGTITLIEIQLEEAKKFVKTTYHRTSSVARTITKIEAETKISINDYVDGILFTNDHGVVITGELTDEKPADKKVQIFSGTLDPWYYLHVKDRTLATADASTEIDYIPLAEYLFRYDRGGFWVGAAIFDFIKFVPFNKFTRWFIDDFIHTRMLYRALHASGESSRFIIQDLGLSYENAEDFINYTVKYFNIWPLWLCPVKQTQPPTFNPHTSKNTNLDGPTKCPNILNIGLWGRSSAEYDEFVSKNRDIEKKLVELDGMKCLYAHTYYNEDEFWKLFDKPWYDALREKYHATTLPTVYEKVKIDIEAKKLEHQNWMQSLWSKPLFGRIYGAWKSFQSKDYLLDRKAEWKYKG